MARTTSRGATQKTYNKEVKKYKWTNIYRLADSLRMASVKKHLSVLKLIQDAKPRLRKSIIIHSDLEFIKTILECIQNTLNGNIKLTDSEKKKLNKYKTVLRKILHSKGNLNKKRELILQNGGSFLSTLLKPIVRAAQK